MLTWSCDDCGYSGNTREGIDNHLCIKAGKRKRTSITWQERIMNNPIKTIDYYPKRTENWS